MLDKSRIQGFGSDDQPKDVQDSSNGYMQNDGIFSRMSLGMSDMFEEFKEEMSAPWNPVQDIQEIASDFSSFVSRTTGIDQSEETGVVDVEQPTAVSPRQRKEAMDLISKFCQGYTACRVAPTPNELGRVWASCSILQPGAVASVIYDQLSWSSGELEWQPRLRILYLLEVLYWRGGAGKDIAVGISSHASGLLSHLATEVPQTREKGRQVIETLAGNLTECPPEISEEIEKKAKDASEEKAVKEKPSKAKSDDKAEKPQAYPQAGATEQKAKAAPASKPETQDLLSLIDSESPSSTPAAQAAPAGAVDLLSSPDLVPSAPPVIDLTAIGAPAPQARSAVAEEAFDPNKSAGSVPSMAGLDFSGGEENQRLRERVAELEQNQRLRERVAELEQRLSMSQTGQASLGGPGFRSVSGPSMSASSSNAAPMGSGFPPMGSGVPPMGSGVPMGSGLAMGSSMGSMGGGFSSMAGFGAPGPSGVRPPSPSSLGGASFGAFGGLNSSSLRPPMPALTAPGSVGQPMGMASSGQPMGMAGSGAPPAASMGMQPRRAPYIPTFSEVQNMQSEKPADPFAFTEKIMEDFTAGH